MLPSVASGIPLANARGSETLIQSRDRDWRFGQQGAVVKSYA